MKTKYKKPDWAVDQLIRETGLVEDICEHGVGHPNKAWLEEHDPDNKKCFAVHGCDGCCSQDMPYQNEEKEINEEKETNDKIDPNQLLLAYQEVFAPIEDIMKITPMKLRDIITELKQSDGEQWAVGEMLERALNFLNAVAIIKRYGI